jgi:hypothetical protein
VRLSDEQGAVQQVPVAQQLVPAGQQAVVPQHAVDGQQVLVCAQQVSAGVGGPQHETCGQIVRGESCAPAGPAVVRTDAAARRSENRTIVRRITAMDGRGTAPSLSLFSQSECRLDRGKRIELRVLLRGQPKRGALAALPVVQPEVERLERQSARLSEVRGPPLE